MKTIFIILAFCLLLLYEGKAQQLVLERIYYPDTTRRIINSSIVTRQGNILLSGNYHIPSQGYRNLHLLVKPNTDTVWIRKSLLQVNGDRGIKQTPDNGFALFGTVLSSTPLQATMVLQKLNSNGFPNWSKTFGGPAIGVALLMAPDSGYFLMGTGGVSPNKEPFIRTDSLGNIKWQKDFTWASNDYQVQMQYTLNSNIIIAGSTNHTYPWRLKLLIINQNGDSLLGQAVDISNPTRHIAMRSTWNTLTPLNDGGFLVTAETDTLQGNVKMGMVLKVDANLQLVWYYIHRTPSFNFRIFTKAKELADGSVLVLSSGLVPATNQFQLYRFSPAGALLNTYTFTTAISSTITTNTLDYLPADTSFLIGGEATVTPWPNYIGGIYVAKVKIAGLPPAVVTGTPKPVPLQPGPLLGQSYPNPTSTVTTISYSLPKNCQKATIILYDVVTGRKVRSYDLPIGKTEGNLSVNVNGLPNGLYAYSLVTDGKPVATKKLAVMK